MQSTKDFMVSLSYNSIIFYNYCPNHRIRIDIASTFFCQFYC